MDDLEHPNGSNFHFAYEAKLEVVFVKYLFLTTSTEHSIGCPYHLCPLKFIEDTSGMEKSKGIGSFNELFINGKIPPYRALSTCTQNLV